jgi:isocitrate dehydrogenase
MAMVTVAEVMRSPVETIGAQAPVSEALAHMHARGVTSVLVEPAEPGGPWGIMTLRDVLAKVIAQDQDPTTLKVADLMTRVLAVTRPQASLQDCAQAMIAYNIRRLPVFDSNRLVGIVSDVDIVNCLEQGCCNPT